jgi:hypothetical protein
MYMIGYLKHGTRNHVTVYKVPLNIIALHGILPATLTASVQWKWTARKTDLNQCFQIEGGSLYNRRFKLKPSRYSTKMKPALDFFKCSHQGRCSHCNLTIKEDMFRSITIIPRQRIWSATRSRFLVTWGPKPIKSIFVFHKNQKLMFSLLYS